MLGFKYIVLKLFNQRIEPMLNDRKYSQKGSECCLNLLFLKAKVENQQSKLTG